MKVIGEDPGDISIHAPPRGATNSTALLFIRRLFQFTPLREGRRVLRRVERHAVVISIHAPPRGATQPRNRQARCSAHFNSRPSARGDGNTFGARKRYCISIHAPPRGATLRRPADGGCRRISIHAPPRGATLNLPPPRAAVPLFQFTPLREGRLDGDEVRLTAEAFQFTPLREGRRCLPTRRGIAQRYFNSRPSARGDTAGGTRPRRRVNFNSRPSARGDTGGGKT